MDEENEAKESPHICTGCSTVKMSDPRCKLPWCFSSAPGTTFPDSSGRGGGAYPLVPAVFHLAEKCVEIFPTSYPIE